MRDVVGWLSYEREEDKCLVIGEGVLNVHVLALWLLTGDETGKVVGSHV
jgi:hypothetical protein